MSSFFESKMYEEIVDYQNDCYENWGLTHRDWQAPYDGFVDFLWQLIVSPVGRFVLNAYLAVTMVFDIFYAMSIAVGMAECEQSAEYVGKQALLGVGFFIANAILAPLYDWISVITRTAVTIASCCSDADNNCSDPEITLQSTGNIFNYT